MRAVVQVVTEATVRARRGDGGWSVVGALPGPGLLVLLGVTHDDTTETARKLAEKIWHLRILDGERSAAALEAPVLVVSQFTLYADLSKGRRPSWSAAAPRPVSEPLVTAFGEALRALGAQVETGEFGATMQVQLINDGPCTLIVDA